MKFKNDIFKIHSICLYARNILSSEFTEDYDINSKLLIKELFYDNPPFRNSFNSLNPSDFQEIYFDSDPNSSDSAFLFENQYRLIKKSDLIPAFINFQEKK